MYLRIQESSWLYLVGWPLPWQGLEEGSDQLPVISFTNCFWRNLESELSFLLIYFSLTLTHHPVSFTQPTPTAAYILSRIVLQFYVSHLSDQYMNHFLRWTIPSHKFDKLLVPSRYNISCSSNSCPLFSSLHAHTLYKGKALRKHTANWKNNIKRTLALLSLQAPVWGQHDNIQCSSFAPGI